MLSPTTSSPATAPEPEFAAAPTPVPDSGPTTSPPKLVAANTGTVARTIPRVKLLWGERGRSTGGLSSALSARITFPGGTEVGGDVSWTVNRAASPGAYAETYPAPNTVPVGDREIRVEFFSGADAGGEQVGEAQAVFPLGDSGAVPGISTVGSVAAVCILPDQTVFVGQPTDLVWTATNARGEVLAVSPGSARFAVGSGETFLRIADGRASGLRPGSAVVRANVDAAESDPATVHVSSRAAVVVSPASATLGPDIALPLSARVDDAPDASVIWSVTGGDAAGTVTADGVYSAPPTPGVYTVIATSVYDVEKSATVTVTVAFGGVSVEIE